MAGTEFGEGMFDDDGNPGRPEERPGRRARADAALDWLEGKSDTSPAYQRPGEFDGENPVLRVEEPDPPAPSGPSWSRTSSDENSEYEQVKKGDGYITHRKRERK